MKQKIYYDSSGSKLFSNKASLSNKNPLKWILQYCKLFILTALLLFVGTKALAINGSSFNSETLIRDLKWNQTEGRVEFKVMVHDNYGDGRNEYIGGNNQNYGAAGNGAKLYIDDVLVAQITEGDEGKATDRVANFCFAGKNYSKINGRFFIQAIKEETTKTAPSLSTTVYSEFQLPTSGYRFYTITPNRVSSDPYIANRMYAEFYWYPDFTIDFDSKNIKIAIKDVQIQEQETWDGKTVANVEKTVTITRPAAQNHSITGGDILQGGKLSFTCKAGEATEIELLKDDVVIETKTGNNVTFTGKYLSSAKDEFYSGKTFSFNVIRKIRDGKTVYKRKSDKTITSQRTGDLYSVSQCSLTPSTCGIIDFKWKSYSPSGNINTQGFDIQIKKGNGDFQDVTGEPDYVIGKYDYSYSYQIPTSDMNKGNINYEFRIKRKFIEWDDKDFIVDFQRNISASINTNYKELSKIELKAGTNNYPLLTWDFTTSGFQCNDDVKLKLKVGNTETTIPQNSILNGVYQTTSSNGIINCSPQRYELILQYGSAFEKSHVVNENYVFEATGKREFERLVVSTGYYPSKVNVKWYIKKNYDEFDSFNVLRRPLESSDSTFTLLENTPRIGGKQMYSYDDNNLNAGIYYEYKIEGVYKCVENSGILSSSTEIGFSQPFGSVSGRITYEGGTAVEGVKVNLLSNDVLRGNRELIFPESVMSNRYVEVPANKNIFSPKGFSFQVWLKRSSTENGYIFNNNGNISLFLQGGGSLLQFEIGGKTLYSKLVAGRNVIPISEYCHLSLTATALSSDYKKYKIAIYINGKAIEMESDTVELDNPLTENNSTVIIGTESSEAFSVIGRSFDGLMDDIRFWKKALTADEIESNYDRVLSGKEKDLAAYYKCDETDAISGILFDGSADGSNFNGNHAKMGSGVNRSDVSASASHLSLKGVTDEDGIYQITNVVPYTNEGTTYTISPNFGIHQFSPNKRPLYFSPDSRVFNNVDFSDVSSFKVKGKVTYANSNYPVDSVQILVDGSAVSKDGELVMTDSEGNFIVDVPIGDHFISLFKNGHVFANEGRFPVKKGTKYNFQDSISGMIFKDMTTVRLAGRVSGGDVESGKVLGFALSKANIGAATIKLKPVNDVYRLNLTDSDSTTYNQIGGKTSTTIFKKSVSGSEIEIKTNAETGEFLAVLPPIPYKVAYVKTADFEDTFIEDTRKFSYSKEVINMHPLSKATVKHPDSTKTDIFLSHDSLRITRYNEPSIAVIDLEAEEAAFGDSIYQYIDNAIPANSKNIALYKKAGNNITYSLGYPAFNQAHGAYSWQISAYEEYVNKDIPSDPVINKVPLAKKDVYINNGLSSLTLTMDTIAKKDSITSSQNAVKLDSLGVAIYKFQPGFPKLSGDHLLSVSISLIQNGKSYSWKNPLNSSMDFKAYMLGMQPLDGSNFITQGPDYVDVVLHDPPGSNSYAWIEKGSTITSEVTKTFQFDTNEAISATLHLAPKIVTSAGFAFSVQTEIELVADIEGGMEWAQSNMEGDTQVTTTTFNEQISTSSDPNHVGAMADVYIGKSTNRVFSKQRNLALYPSAQAPDGTPIGTDNFKLFTKEIIAVGQDFNTTFSYTQDYIINTLIPNTKQIRNSKIESVTAIPDPIPFDAEKNPMYYTLLPEGAPNYGEDKTYYVFFAKNAPTDKRIDEVADYNMWIANWEQTIANNEEHKVNLFDSRATAETKGTMRNRSFDGGVSITESNTASFEKTELDYSMKSFGGYNQDNLGSRVNGMGVSGQARFSRNNIWADENNTSNANELTFGFSLAEEGTSSDALTVDIYNPMGTEMAEAVLKNKEVKNLHGYAFKRVAGQTTCPYEGEELTLYYDKGNHTLNEATFKIENPDLYIDGKKTALAANISSGREASFNLELQNQSQANLPVVYQLWVDEASNPDGLILSIDGSPLTSPRNFLVQYGKSSPLFKTLKVRQSSQDILDYSGIKLVMGSSCDDQIASEVAFNVTFMQASSPISLSSNRKLVNREHLNNGGKVSFTISDYDRSFRDFGCIRMQYKKTTEETWTTLKEYVIDEKLYPVEGNKEKLETDAVNYDYIFKETTPSDGEYLFRAISVSKTGTGEVTSSSEEIQITKDVRVPQVLGYTSPVDGILSSGDEISITFNEDIQTGMLTDDKFSITGILNEAIRTEPTVGLSFDGNKQVFTEQPIFTNASFSIETWFKYPQKAAGTLFAYGDGNAYISLGFDAAGHAVVKIGTETKTSSETISASDVWKHIGLSYDRSNNTVSVYVAEATDDKNMFQSVSFANEVSTQGKLYVGNNAQANNGFKGSVGLLHFYSTARSKQEMNQEKYSVKSGNEPNLIGLWEMEEGEGTLAKDKARSRHLTLNGTSWYIYPQGRSITFNGTNQHAALASGTFPFGSYDDFTWEFWFKGANQAKATLLSVGTETQIGFNDAHELILTREGVAKTLTTNNLLDDKWHHLALSVKRGGMTNVFIDGVTVSSFNSNFFNGSVGGGYYYLGAKYVKEENSSTFKQVEHFKGNIDEVRVWNNALALDAVLLEKNHKLRKTEAGLLAYYPFETTEKRDQVWDVFESKKDVISNSEFIGTAVISNTAAPMQEARPVKDVAFTFTASERKIVFNILEADYLIEGVTLKITSNAVLDMHNNPSNATTWTAYVDRNALNWQTDNIDLLVEQGQNTSFTAKIANSSSTKVDYEIEDIPSWLTVNAALGTLQPLGTKDLTFSVQSGINIGSYEASIVLVGTNNVRKVLPVRLKVTGQRPDWTVNPYDYELSMSVIATVQIEGVPQEDEDDIVGAFIEDLCVGIAQPKYSKPYNAYHIFMNVYGNGIHENKNIKFKLWDASTGRIYPQVATLQSGVAQNVTFVSNDTKYAKILDPLVLDTKSVIEQQIQVNSGWNWISANVTSDSPSILEQIKTQLGDNCVILKSQSSYIQSETLNGNITWSGTLDTIVPAKGYMIDINQPQQLKLEGKIVSLSSTPISLYHQWNWIGYTPQLNLAVAEALSGINSKENDQIKAQSGFDVYNENNGWIGSLDVMKPGKAYMYYSNSTSLAEFNYPSASGSFSRIPAMKYVAATTQDNKPTTHWTTDFRRFANNMTMTSIVLQKNEELKNTSIEIAAFVGDDCRGNVLLSHNPNMPHEYMGFLMVYGENEDKIQFKVYNHETGVEYNANNEDVYFRINEKHGNGLNPYEIKISAPASVSDTWTKGLSIYPNPVVDNLYIKREFTNIDKLEVTDLSGRIVMINDNFTSDYINVSSLETGMYILKLTHEDSVKSVKFMKQ